jgi:hypothetical protein
MIGIKRFLFSLCAGIVILLMIGRDTIQALTSSGSMFVSICIGFVAITIARRVFPDGR